MRKLHHFGIPVTNPVDGETHNDELHLFCTDVAASPNKIEFYVLKRGVRFPNLFRQCRISHTK